MESSQVSLTRTMLNISTPVDQGISLSKGEVLKGTVQEVRPDGTVLLQIKGQVIEAAAEVPVSPGQQLYLRVDDFRDGKTYLKVLTPEGMEQIENTNISVNLAEIGVQAKEVNVMMARKLLQYNLPVTHNNLNEMARGVKILGDANPRNLELVGFAMSRGVKITPENLKALAQYTMPGSNLARLLQSVSQSLEQLMRQEAAANQIKNPAEPAVQNYNNTQMSNAAQKTSLLKNLGVEDTNSRQIGSLQPASAETVKPEAASQNSAMPIKTPASVNSAGGIRAINQAAAADEITIIQSNPGLSEDVLQPSITQKPAFVPVNGENLSAAASLARQVSGETGQNIPVQGDLLPPDKVVENTGANSQPNTPAAPTTEDSAGDFANKGSGNASDNRSALIQGDKSLGGEAGRNPQIGIAADEPQPPASQTQPAARNIQSFAVVDEQLPESKPAGTTINKQTPDSAQQPAATEEAARSQESFAIKPTVITTSRAVNTPWPSADGEQPQTGINQPDQEVSSSPANARPAAGTAAAPAAEALKNSSLPAQAAVTEEILPGGNETRSQNDKIPPTAANLDEMSEAGAKPSAAGKILPEIEARTAFNLTETADNKANTAKPDYINLIRSVIDALKLDGQQSAAEIKARLENLVAGDRDTLRGLMLLDSLLKNDSSLTRNPVIGSLLQRLDNLEREIAGQNIFNFISRSSVDNQFNYYYFSFPVQVNQELHLCQLRINREAGRKNLKDQDSLSFVVSLDTAKMGMVLFHCNWKINRSLAVQGVVENDKVARYLSDNMNTLINNLSRLGYTVQNLGIKVSQPELKESLKPHFEEVPLPIRPLGIDIKV